MRSLLRILAVLAAGLGAAAHAAGTSDYAGQERRDIKSMSADEIEGYLSGKGQGLAKPAELNGYPGPSHVLALSRELALSDEQRRRTEVLFAAMQAEASERGRTFVAAERDLDRLFATGTVDRSTLEAALQRSAALLAAVRQVHLVAHLKQIDILDATQRAKYAALRGYDDATAQPQPHHHH